MNDKSNTSSDTSGTGIRMDALFLRLKENLPLPLEAEVISPDVFGKLSQEEIRNLPVLMGNRHYRLSDFFEVEGEKSCCLELQGNLAQVKWIGRGMTAGSIVIRGNAGMHLGAEMTGGAITVFGNTADWLGAEMTGGTIRIHGDAGGQVGAAYRGSRKGMRNGTIVIDGAAGIEVGMRMRRGLICIRGKVGDFAGLQLQGGTIFLGSAAGIRTGAWMSRGTIVALEPIRLLPTFQYACTYDPVFLRLLLKQLPEWGATFSDRGGNGCVRRYTGDISGLGKGEILICAAVSDF
jgi:formylmethanofuran dehydrogenase subunit C